MKLNRKAIFDFFRSRLGRGLKQSEVDQLDDLLDGKLLPDPPSEPEKSEAPERVSAVGIALLHKYEGCARKLSDGRVAAYPDPGTGGAPWTIGWGATRGGLHGFVDRGTVWTQRQCDERFESDLVRYAKDVVRALGSAINSTSQAQFDALVSFHYNTGAIARATLTKKHKAGDHIGAAAEFGRWNRAGGRVMRGLSRRRAEEADLYRSGS